MVAQLQLELATLHQLHTKEEEQAKRLQFKGESLLAQLQDITGRLNEIVFSRDEALARAESLQTALSRSEQLAAAQASISTLGREHALRAKVRFAQFFRIDIFLCTHGVSDEVDSFCRQVLKHRVWGGWALPDRADPMYPVTVTTCVALDAIMGLYPTDGWPFLDRPPPERVSLAQFQPLSPQAPVSKQVTFTGAERPGGPGGLLQLGSRFGAPLFVPVFDMAAVSNALIPVDRDAGHWPPGHSEQLAKVVHFFVATGAVSKSVGFPRTALYDQWV